jgi:epoxyqueuosine reductase
MKEAIRQRARELGFDVCGFTSAAPPASAPHFRRWIEAHWHGEMGYLQRNADKRIDPTQVLPGARSIICLGTSYHRSITMKQTQAPPTVHGAQPEQAIRGCEVAGGAVTGAVSDIPHSPFQTPHWHGAIARYARFGDYHEILAGRLQDLTRFINHFNGEEARSLWYVDTGPLLERDLGQRAGLGFIGKHTNLISRKLGNWFFLSEIITTVELEPDVPEKNRCGTCARCIAACPTRAITAPFQLDARRCISYLTIELKGAIPEELRPAMGNRIYGCDDCLEACPWNRFAQEGRLMRGYARADLEVPDLLDLLELDDAAFKSRFQGTPLWRAKRRGLLRNVCVALGNLGDVRALPALERAALDPEPLIAEHARWAMRQIDVSGNSHPAPPFPKGRGLNSVRD